MIYSYIFLYEPMILEHCDSLKQDDCAAGDGLGSTENYDDVDVDMPRVSKDSEKSPVERFVTLALKFFHILSSRSGSF